MSATANRRRGMPDRVATVADKRFRRPDVRPAKQRRSSRRLWRLGAGVLGIVVLTVVGVWAASRALDSQWLAVDRLAIHGNERLSAAAVETQIGSVRGQNLLRVDLQHLQEQLLESPWVAAVTVRRVLPSTVDIHVVERDPIALARLDGALYLVDASGVIIDQYGPQYGDFDLPIVDGMAVKTPKGGAAIDPGRAQLVARFLAAMAQRPELRRSLSQLDVSRDANVAVLLNDDPTQLFLGDEQFVDRLRTYLEIRPTLAEQMDDVDYVDLRFGQRVVVKNRGDRARRQ
jgi:cell division septal protein FtsQ